MPPEFFDKMLDRLVRRLQSGVDPVTCDHYWLICGCVLSDVSLDTSCTKCGVYGSVKDPTPGEWEHARDSIANPYPWQDNSRVTAGTTKF